MSVLRWKVRRFAGWCLPLVAFLLVLIWLIPFHQVAPAGEGAFLSDEAYRHLAVSATLKRAGVYGVRQDQPIPAVQDMLWRGALALGQFVIPNPSAAARVLGMGLGVVTILLLLRLCRLMFPYPFFGYVTAGLLILTPGLAAASLSGLADPLAMFLVTCAVVLHLYRIQSTGEGLPSSAMYCIGLAMWLRLEFVLVWFLLWTHALMLSAIPGKTQESVTGAWVRGFNGLLLLALLMLPVVAWNWHTLGVPWPRMPDAPMAANLWAVEGPAAAWSTTLEWMRIGWSEGFTRFRSLAVPTGVVGNAFWVLGLLVLLWQVIRSEEDRPYLLLLLAPWLIPLFYAVIFPYVGWFSFDLLASAFLPLGVLCAAYGVVRLPFLFEALLSKHVPHWPAMRLFQGWWSVAGGALILAALVGQVRAAHAHQRALAQVTGYRTLIGEAIETHALMRDRFISDQPGWLAQRHEVTVIDVRGEWTPSVLGYVRIDGTYDWEQVGHYLEGLNPPPGVAVIWDERYVDVEALLPALEVLMEPDAEDPDQPWMFMGTWPGML